MTDHDELSSYPCPRWSPYQRHGCEPGPACREYEEHCDYEKTYRAHIKLRDDIRTLRAAVLGDMTPAEAEAMYRTASKRESGYVNSQGRFNALADVVVEL
ncbi:hypothetical protein LCGC14_0520420 [marine sediment metagenome]|uniref:Uncharacterized protein n=1 Tax=marine sediment metagenome TaxID=412755 RepID=A0A0F9S3E5_9ZZZZ